VLIETYTGTLGPSVRAVVPVFGPDHTVRGLVAVGIKVSAISAALTRRLLPLAAVALAALLVGGLGSVLISARLRRQTMGLAPAELGRVFASYQATLHAMREGLVLVGADGRVALCNDGAMRLLGLDQSPVGRPVTELGLPAGLAQALSTALSTDEPLRDEIHLTDTRVLVVNSAPVRSGRDRANVVTLRDHTDLQRLTGELNTTRDLAESLHAQAHEAANRLHTVISLVELGRTQEAIEFATAELNLAQRLTDQVVGAVAEPVLAALLLGKAAEASERGVELVLTEDSALGELDVGAAAVESRALVTVVGNLVDNAIDAAVLGRGAAKVEVTVRADGEELLLRVADTGPGVAPAARDAVFQRGWSSKPSDGPAGRGLGLALVGQAVRRSGGSVQLTDSAGGGAEFTVRLPLTRPVG
jgi:sensor histidine kinase regulating citrate/malate metabolism